MLTATGESGREYTGFDLAAALLEAGRLKNLADELKRRGGGFTAHAEALLRARAERCLADALLIETLFAEQGGA